jgi:hypothetical protein
MEAFFERIMYRTAVMLGRLSNGAQADHGVVVHLVYFKKVPSLRFPDKPISAEVSLCGKRPGPKSVGWSGYWKGDEVLKLSCEKCLKRAQRLKIEGLEKVMG